MRPMASVTDVLGSLPIRMVPKMWAPDGTFDSPGNGAGGLLGMKPANNAPAALRMAASLGPMEACDDSSKAVGLYVTRATGKPYMSLTVGSSVTRLSMVGQSSPPMVIAMMRSRIGDRRMNS